MTALLYRSDYPNDCRTRAIDGVTLIFHRPSGATHFLVGPATEILRLLAEAPMDGARLCRRLCDDIGIAADEAAQAVVDARLAELVGIGLVRTD